MVSLDTLRTLGAVSFDTYWQMRHSAFLLGSSDGLLGYPETRTLGAVSLDTIHMRHSALL